LSRQGRDVRRGRPALLFSLLLAAAPAAAGDYAAELAARARALGLARERAWLTLGHYTRSGSGWESHASGDKFFLAPDGKRDPQAELEADLRGFLRPPEAGARAHPQCRFPARYAWLKEKLAFDPARLPKQACPAFAAWRDAMDAKGVTLVFANAYLNNPGSMYGHTFLRLPRKDAGGGEDSLNDYTINFAATPDTENGVLYALRGIVGSFPGEYSVMPYYLKIQEYTNLESRDLWEYDLNLTQAQADRLLEHAWEMGSTYFPYYFFDENCSYQLLTLLDAALPDARLGESFWATVIPADTVRAILARPGLVAGARYRPSYVTQMLARRARLSPTERSLATRLGRAKPALGELAALPVERQALVLDSAADYLRYRVGFSSEQSTRTLQGERALLVARGRLGVPSPPLNVDPPPRLEEGHDTARVSAGFGAARSGPFEEIGWRGALHDLTAPDAGYIPYSQLEMMDLRLRVDDRSRKPYIERLALVDIASLVPWDPWVPQISWRASTGVDQAKEYGCAGPSCMYYDGNVGGGIAYSTSFLGRELYYALAEGNFGVGPILDRTWRLGAGASAGVILDPLSFWRVQCEATYIGYGWGPARERLRLANAFRLSRDLELRVTLDRRVPEREAGFALNVYF
jgi:hypothetical protein